MNLLKDGTAKTHINLSVNTNAEILLSYSIVSTPTWSVGGNVLTLDFEGKEDEITLTNIDAYGYEGEEKTKMEDLCRELADSLIEDINGKITFTSLLDEQLTITSVSSKELIIKQSEQPFIKIKKMP